MWRRPITEAITQGVKDACWDIPTFTEDWSGTLAAEYLLTVRVAMAIRDLNKDYGGIGFPLKVHIEERTRRFVRKCIPLWPPIVDSECRKRIYGAIERKGKIDIGVTYDSRQGPGSVPACVIEIKGFDPAISDTRKDLIRNANFMKVAELTGRQEMFSSFVVLHEGDAIDFTNKAADIKRIRKHYEREVGSIQSRLQGLEVDYVVFTASENFNEPVERPEELDYFEDSPHHFVCAIVTFYQKTVEN